MKLTNAEHYQKYKAHYTSKRKRWKLEHPDFKIPKNQAHFYNLRKYNEGKEHIIKLKDRPCQDCGIKFPHYAMDFDHRPGTIKIADIAHMKQKRLSVIDAEAAKCDVVCANCHRRRSWDRSHE